MHLVLMEVSSDKIACRDVVTHPAHVAEADPCELWGHVFVCGELMFRKSVLVRGEFLVEMPSGL